MSAGGSQFALDHRDHVVHFYADDADLSHGVTRYLAEGLSAGGSAVVVATREHRSELLSGLAAMGVHGEAESSGRLIMVDAAEMLNGFLAGDRLDHAGFRRATRDLINQAVSAAGPVRIYAEMVALLWDAGQVTLALELETLWNDLASQQAFSLLCGYPVSVAASDSDSGAVEQVCRLHTEVTTPFPGLPGMKGLSPDVTEAVRSFPRTRDSARAAREFVTGNLGSWAGGTLATDAAIVIAELASNAVLHARTPFTVTVSRWADRVRIAVRDAVPLAGAGHGRLVTKPGHGLDLVAKVARRWAVEPLADGKVVWAELPVPPRRDSR
jgi:hypothetical protein